jgi:hypothetical protein
MTAGASRIVVTGVGLLSAARSSMAELVDSLDRRQHCLSLISSFDATSLNATQCRDHIFTDRSMILGDGQGLAIGDKVFPYISVYYRQHLRTCMVHV